MVANALVTTRIDLRIKDEASVVLQSIGLTVSDAVRLLLTRVAQDGALPFDLVSPSKKVVGQVRRARQSKAAQAHVESSEVAALPETSPQRYLSGMAALNLPSREGTGDWHLIETFFRPGSKRSRLFVAGEGCEGNTNSLLGARGVFECASILDELNIPHPTGPVYSANHARAIADLVLVSVLHGGSPDFVQLDDWMPREEDKQEVFNLLAIAVPSLDSRQREKVLLWQETS